MSLIAARVRRFGNRPTRERTAKRNLKRSSSAANYAVLFLIIDYDCVQSIFEHSVIGTRSFVPRLTWRFLQLLISKGSYVLSRIGLISPVDATQEHIRKKLQNVPGFHVIPLAGFQQLQTFVSRANSLDLLILRYDNFTLKNSQALASAIGMLQNLAHRGVIILAKRFEGERIAEYNHQSPHTKSETERRIFGSVLKWPDEEVDLIPLIRQGVSRQIKHLALRTHFRSRRSQRIQLVSTQGHIFSGKFFDMSQMGAQVIIRQQGQVLSGFRNRDSVQLVYVSSQNNMKIHRIESKVVWTKLDEMNFNSPIVDLRVGLRFLGRY